MGLAYFLDNTSLHGYFYIGSARNLAEKLFWSLIVVVALTLAVITIRKTEVMCRALEDTMCFLPSPGWPPVVSRAFLLADGTQ